MTNENKKELREFGFLIGFGIPLIIGWLIPTLISHSLRIWTIYFGLPIIFLSIFKPTLLKNLYKVWMKLGHILGWINSKLILGVIFFIVLLPIAFLMKSMGYDPLKIKFSKDITYRVNKSKYNLDLTRIF